MPECQEQVFEMFDRISSRYDLTNRILSFWMDMRWRRFLSHHLPAKKELSLLDLATGTGDQLCALFEKKAPIAKAIGIDLSTKMLEIAQSKLSKKSYGQQIELKRADAQHLPFSNDSFDLCTFSFGIRNVESPLLALSEMHRVTSSRGRCLILEFSLPETSFRLPYLFYLRHLLPKLGGWLTKDANAYKYLNKTIEAFAYGEEFLSWMREAGWTQATAIPLLFGSVTLYRGDKV